MANAINLYGSATSKLSDPSLADWAKYVARGVAGIQHITTNGEAMNNVDYLYVCQILDNGSITLPYASAVIGRQLVIRNIADNYPLTIQRKVASDLIDGENSNVTLDGEGSLVLVSRETIAPSARWHVISGVYTNSNKETHLWDNVSASFGRVVKTSDVGSITNSMIANDTISSGKLQDSTITSAKIVNGTITSDDLANNSVIESKIDTYAVTNTKIQDGAVGPRKMASQITIKTENYTLTASDRIVTASGTLTITLPNVSDSSIQGRMYTIRNVSSSTVTIARTSSQGIDGCTGTITLPGRGYITVISNGTGWNTLGAEYFDESIGRRLYRWSDILANGANTGWQMVYGDTGWRDMSASISSTLLALNPNASAYLRRQNGNIDFYYYSGTSASQSGTASAMVLPTGLAPNYIPSNNMIVNTGSSTTAALYASATKIMLSGTSSNTQYIGSLAWSTDSAWPTALPGSAVGSIPQ